MLIANLYGRIGADPVARTTKAGKPMATCSVAVDVAGRDAEPSTLWVSLLAFGAAAEGLLRAEKGQMASAIGRLSRGGYTGKDGTEREQWTMLAEAVVTARSARPPGRKPKSNGPREYSANHRVQEPSSEVPFDDDLPF